MQVETVRVDTLESMVDYLRAHLHHLYVIRSAAEVQANDVEKASVIPAGESQDRPVVFADATARRVQVELDYWSNESGRERERKVLVWEAGRGVPDDVEALRKLAGQRVILRHWLEGLRIVLPGEQFERLEALCDGVRSRVGVSLVDDMARLTWDDGIVPKLAPIAWSVPADDGFGEISITLRPSVGFDPKGLAIFGWYGIDVEEPHDTPTAFREHVRGLDWPDTVSVIFGAPPKETRLLSPVTRALGDGPFELTLEVGDAGYLTSGRRGAEGMLRRLNEMVSRNVAALPIRGRLAE